MKKKEEKKHAKNENIFWEKKLSEKKKNKIKYKKIKHAKNQNIANWSVLKSHVINISYFKWFTFSYTAISGDILILQSGR